MRHTVVIVAVAGVTLAALGWYLISSSGIAPSRTALKQGKALALDVPRASCLEVNEASVLLELYKQPLHLSDIPEGFRWAYSLKGREARQEMLAELVATILEVYPQVAEGKGLAFNSPTLYEQEGAWGEEDLSEEEVAQLAAKVTEASESAPAGIRADELKAAVLASFLNSVKSAYYKEMMQELLNSQKLKLSIDDACPLPTALASNQLPTFHRTEGQESDTVRQKVTVFASAFCSQCRIDLPGRLAGLTIDAPYDYAWAPDTTPSAGDLALFDLASCGIITDFNTVFSTPLELSKDYRATLDYWSSAKPDAADAIKECSATAEAVQARNQLQAINRARSDKSAMFVLFGNLPLPELKILPSSH